MIKAIDSAVQAVAAALVAATVIFTCLAVFFRYILNSALGWPQEVSGYILVWISFLGAYLASRENRHVSFDVVIDKLPNKLRRAITLSVDVVLIVYFLILLRMSIRMIGIVGHNNIETLEIPFGVFMAILPISSVLIVFALILNILQQLRAGDR